MFHRSYALDDVLGRGLGSRQRSPPVAMHDRVVKQGCTHDIRNIRLLREKWIPQPASTDHWLHKLPHLDDHDDVDDYEPHNAGTLGLVCDKGHVGTRAEEMAIHNRSMSCGSLPLLDLSIVDMVCLLHGGNKHIARPIRCGCSKGHG